MYTPNTGFDPFGYSHCYCKGMEQVWALGKKVLGKKVLVQGRAAMEAMAAAWVCIQNVYIPFLVEEHPLSLRIQIQELRGPLIVLRQIHLQHPLVQPSHPL